MKKNALIRQLKKIGVSGNVEEVINWIPEELQDTPECLRLFTGCETEEELEKASGSLSADLERFRANMNEYLSSRSPYDYIYWVCSRDGDSWEERCGTEEEAADAVLSYYYGLSSSEKREIPKRSEIYSALCYEENIDENLFDPEIEDAPGSPFEFSGFDTAFEIIDSNFRNEPTIRLYPDVKIVYDKSDEFPMITGFTVRSCRGVFYAVPMQNGWPGYMAAPKSIRQLMDPEEFVIFPLDIE